jgi:hypothetical protein
MAVKKERKVILDPMNNLPENLDGYFCPALKVKRSTLRGTRQKFLVITALMVKYRQ